MQKRGVSAVVATILIILIVVAAVAIIWGAIIPMIKDADFSSIDGVDLTIVTSEGYTVFDSEERLALVHVKRGTDEMDLIAVEIIFSVDGSSYTVNSDDVPEPNEARKYIIDLDDEEFDDFPDAIPDSVKVVPIYTVNGQVKRGQATSEVEMPLADIDDVDVADLRSDANTGSGSSPSAPGGSGGDECTPDCDGKECGDDGCGNSCGDCSGNSPYCVEGVCVECRDDGDCEDLCSMDHRCVNYKELTDCGVLDEAGRVYLLKRDLLDVEQNCFSIQADGVTLDLGGYVVSSVGPYDAEWGVFIEEGADDFKVQYGGVNNFGNGIIVLGDNGLIESVEVSNNLYVGVTIDSNSEGTRLMSVESCDNGEFDFYCTGSVVDSGVENTFGVVSACPGGWPEAYVSC